MSLPENAWSRVGAQGKHRHVPSQPGTPKSTPRHNSSHPTQAPQPHDCQLSLLALPATALACIFQHLNGVDGFSLAQTCHACASEFAHQKADFTQKVCEELAPTITCDPPSGDHECYGTASNPVSLHVKWEKNPGSALRRLYAMSQQPDCLDVVNELWRQAWPQALWSDLLCDGLSHVWPVAQFDAHSGASHHNWNMPLSINIEFQVSSDEPLQLPWEWLAKNLLFAPAAGLRFHLSATAPQQLQEDLHQVTLTADWWTVAETLINVSLHRPAQADQSQQVMSQSFRYHAGQDNEDWYDPYGDALEAWAPPKHDVVAYSGLMYYKPCNEQKVAITGSWCQVLPDASHDLSDAVYFFEYDSGLHDMHRTLGDDMTVSLKDTAEHLENLWRAHFDCRVHGVTAWDEAAVDLEHVLENLKALWQDVPGRHVCGVTLHAQIV